MWPDHLRTSALDFLEKVSHRVGIYDTHGGVNDWQGFNKLGLSLGFEHSVPDATLPIFYWEQNGWKPLLRRT
ncbi:MAG: phosphoribosyltransferase-like protein [Janthinobacterium lividum]